MRLTPIDVLALGLLTVSPVGGFAQVNRSCYDLSPYADTVVDPGGSIEVGPWTEFLSPTLRDNQLTNGFNWSDYKTSFIEKISDTTSTLTLSLPGRPGPIRTYLPSSGEVYYQCLGNPITVRDTGSLPPVPTPIADHEHAADGFLFPLARPRNEEPVAIALDGSYAGTWPLEINNVGDAELQVHWVMQPIETDRVKFTFLSPVRDLTVGPHERRTIWLQLEVTDWEKLRANRILTFPFLMFSNDNFPPLGVQPGDKIWTAAAHFQFKYYPTLADIPTDLIAPTPPAEVNANALVVY